MCVCVTTYAPVLARLHNSYYKKHSGFIKQFCGFNRMHEMNRWS